MADNQSIEIQIQSQADQAIKSIDRIDDSLSNVKSSLESISSSLIGLSSRITPVSNAIGKLARDVNKISPDPFNKIGQSANRAASDVDKSAQQIEKSLASLTREYKDNFDISAKGMGMDKLKESITGLYNARERMSFANEMGDQQAFEAAAKEADAYRESLERVAKEYGRVDYASQNAYRELAEWVKSTNASGMKIYLNPEIKGDFGKEASNMAKTLGKAFTFNKDNALMEFDSYMEEIRNKFQYLDWSGNVQDDFARLVERVKEGRIQVLSFNEAMRRGVADVDDVKTAVDTLDGKLSEMANKNAEAFVKSSMSSYAEDMQEMQSAADGLSGSMDRIGDSTGADTASQKMGDVKTKLTEVGDEAEKTSNKLSEIFDKIPDEDLSSKIDLSGLEEKINGFADNIKEEFGEIKLKLPPADTSNLDDVKTKMEETGKAKADSWGDVIADIERMEADYGRLAESIGEANAQLSTSQDIANRVKQAFSATSSGKMLFDTENMRLANAYMKEAEGHINQFKSEMDEQYQFNIDVVEPTSELGKLYNRAQELKDLLDSMRNNRIQFDNSDVQQNLKELENVNNRIKELEGGGDNKKKDIGTTEWMAQIIAVQHELEKASALFNKMGDVAKNAFMKALTPLKLFKHEFEEIKTFVGRIGSAFAMISKPITKVFQHFRKSAEEAFAKIRKAWAKVLRTFTFMLIRKAITHLLSTLNDATTSLAAFSKSIGTAFNTSMSYLTSDLRYIGASLVAAFSPILNAIIPTFDKFSDVIVGVINKVNMFLAVLTGAKSFTIAKKKIVDYTDSVKDASKATKQLTLGVDELNILNDKSNTSDNSLEDMFDWEEIPTPKIELPDPLKLVKEFIDALIGALKEAWDRVKDYVLEAVQRLIDAVGKLLSDVIKDFTTLFNEERFKKLLETILHILGNIINFIAAIIEKIDEAWNHNKLGLRILETITDILLTIATHIDNITMRMAKWAETLTFVPLFESILYALQKINYAVDQIGNVAEDVANVIMGLLTMAIEDYIPRLIHALGDVIEGIGNIAKNFHEAWTELSFGEKLVMGLDGIIQAILPHIEAVAEGFKEWTKGLDFKPLMKSIDELLRSLAPVADFIGGVFEDLVNHYIEPMAKHIIEEVVPEIALAIAHFADAVDWTALRANIDKIISAFASLNNAIGHGVAEAIDELGQAVARFINSKEFSAFIDTITEFVNKIDGNMIAKILVGIGTAILNLASAVAKFGSSKLVKDFLESLINFINTSSVEDIANIVTGIAKAFLLFKGLSFLAQTASHIAGLLVPIMQLVGVVGTGGLLVGALAAGALAFIAFHDQIAMIDWAGLGKMIIEGFVNVIRGIDWEAVAHDLAITIGNMAKYAITIAFDSKWVAYVILVIGEALAEVVKGFGDGVFDIFIQAFHDLGWDSVAGFIEGLKAQWDVLWGFVGEIFNALIEFIKGLLGIHSPSTVMAEIGANFVQGFWNGISATWDAFYQWIMGLWNAFLVWCQEIWNGIVGAIVETWNGFSEQIATVWQTINDWFVETWTLFQAWVSEIWGLIVQSIIDAWNGFIEQITAMWQTINDWFVETWSTFHEWVAEIWGLIVQTIVNAWTSFTDTIKAVWETFKEYITDAWNNFKQWTTTLWGKIRDFLIKVWETVKERTLSLWNAIWTFISTLWTKLKDTAKKIFEFIRDTVVEIWTRIQLVTSEIWTAISGFLAGLWQGIKDLADSIFSGIRDFLTAVWNKIQETWEHAWNGIKTAVEYIWRKIKEGAEALFGALKLFLEPIWNGLEALWSVDWGAIHDTLGKKWESIKETAQQKFKDIKDKIAAKWEEMKSDANAKWEHISQVLQAKWNSLKGTANSIWGSLAKVISDAWKQIKEAVNDTFNGMKSFISGVKKEIESAVQFVQNLIDKFNALREAKKNADNPDEYADGGYPSKGSVFIAGEKGAELVGTINNKTAVANTQEITDAIENAVADAMGDLVENLTTSMDKLVTRLDKAMDTLVEVFEDGFDNIIPKIDEIANETSHNRETLKAYFADVKDLIREMMSRFVAGLEATSDSINSSNEDLRNAYQHDDSAVNNALSRMSQSYEFSNDAVTASIDGVTKLVESGFSSLASVVESGSSASVDRLEQVAKMLLSVHETLLGMSVKMDKPDSTAETNFATSDITGGIDALGNVIMRAVEGTGSYLASISSSTESVSNAIGLMQVEIQGVDDNLSRIKDILHAIATTGMGLSIPAYATGGFVEDGLFYANHNELIGSFNGRTVVANNDQITEGIREAVASAMIPYLSQIEQNTRETAQKDLTVAIGDREIARAANNGQEQLGKTLIHFS